MAKTQNSSTVHSFAKRFAYQHWRWYLAGILALVVTNYITLKIPALAKIIVNMLDQAQPLTGAKDIALLMVGLGFLLIVVRSLSRVLIFWPGRKIESDTKFALIERLLYLPTMVFARFSLGDLISRLSNDAGQLRVLYAFAFLQLANLIFLAIFTISQMTSVHLGLTIAALSPLLLMVVISRYFMPKMHFYSRKNQIALGDLTSVVSETFVHPHVIQSNNAEASFLERIKIKNQDVFDSDMKLIMIRNFIFPLMAALSGVCEVVVLFYGGKLIIGKHLSIGDILAFNVYISFLSWPLTSIGVILGVIQRAKAAIERIDVILLAPLRKTKASLDQGNLNYNAPQAQVVFELKDLVFRYPESQGPKEREAFILQVAELKIRKGEKIGISGSVGSGKTSFFHLLAALLEPESGSLRYFGQEMSFLPADMIREKIIYVPQTSHLFSDTVFQNITMANPALDADDVRNLAKICQVEEDIQHFPEGYETQIGERGIRLSGGQKQRLALARSFAKAEKSMPSEDNILLIDDALSAVDEHTEREILDAVFHRFSTVILSSHRHSALSRCQRWFLFEGGKVREVGLEDLLAF